MNRRHVLLAAGALAACGDGGAAARGASFFASRGVNLGNALEAPHEGDWGFVIEQRHVAAIAAAGFDGVRLPVRWDAHAGAAPPYAIDPAFLDRVEQVVLQCLAAGLNVQLDAHHYEDLIVRPETERARFLALWTQIAARFADAPQSMLAFEIVNEPFGAAWDGALLTDLQSQVIALIRETNPRRPIVVGPGHWQSIEALTSWRPPEATNIGVSVHYYEPYAFTHQHAEWLGANAPIYPRVWGKSEDIARVQDHIAQAARWARAHNLPLQIGEFGANARVPLAQRAAWMRAVRQACEREGAAWCAWDFAGAFPIYMRETGRFMPQMLNALIPTHQ